MLLYIQKISEVPSGRTSAFSVWALPPCVVISQRRREAASDHTFRLFQVPGTVCLGLET